MSDNTFTIKQIEKQVQELNQQGINLAPFKTLFANNNKAVEDFLIDMYHTTITKSTNRVKFTKNIKLINKNPSFSENFTFKNTTDINKLMKQKHSKKAAYLMNFINSFTQILEEENLNMVFTTQTIDSPYRHNDLVDLESNILLQKDVLNSFHRNENKNFYFFKKIDSITSHNSKRREFIRSLEFHKDFNLHEHTIKVFDNSLEHTINYIKMYDKNRIKHKEIGRCEIVIPNSYKEEIIKAFSLKKHTEKNKKDFYYSDTHFKGTLSQGNLLCIKFFEKGEEVNKQIVKYLVSYLNKSGKDIYQHIFNNLKIRNFTHSNVLFSKTLYEKLYKHLSKSRKLEKYKSLYHFTKEYKANNIDIRFEYENTVYNSAKLDKLQNLNNMYNNKLHMFKSLDNGSKQYKTLLHHYHSFINRNKSDFSKMVRVMIVEFEKEDIVLKIDINKYKPVSSDEYKKIKKVDSSIISLNKAIKTQRFIISNDIYNEQQKQYAYDIELEDISYEDSSIESINRIICEDIINENIQHSKNERFSNYRENIDSSIKDIGKFSAENSGSEFDFYMKVGVDRLKGTLECYKSIEIEKADSVFVLSNVFLVPNKKYIEGFLMPIESINLKNMRG